MNQSLDLKILDLTTRLPGPLATKLLQQLGAQITKVEFDEVGDPFNSKENEVEPIFKEWYININRDKEIIKIPRSEFENFDFSDFDIIFYSPHKSINSFLPKDKTKIEILGGKSPKYLHDLNALVLSKSFHISNGEIPYLPFAGILYGTNIALSAISFHYSAQEKSKSLTTYLTETPKHILDLFWSNELNSTKEKLFLHNGKFPCYNIYKSRDGNIIAMAAVEIKFWQRFCEIFELDFEIEDRFNTSPQVKNKITDTFIKYNTNQLQEILKYEDICITFLPT